MRQLLLPSADTKAVLNNMPLKQALGGPRKCRGVAPHVQEEASRACKLFAAGSLSLQVHSGHDADMQT